MPKKHLTVLTKGRRYYRSQMAVSNSDITDSLTFGRDHDRDLVIILTFFLIYKSCAT